MIPAKPFDSYKWRWLSVAPTEGLLNPPVLLGVLRVLARHEGEAPASPAIVAELAVVEAETRTPVHLARTEDRNLIRNSGQYWKGTGLLRPDRARIQLTSLGHRIAEGRMTQGEFAAVMVRQTVLPNPWTYAEAEFRKWGEAGLQIRPLALILAIIVELGRKNGDGAAAYLSPGELIQVVIPLAGQKIPPAHIANYVARFRRGTLDVTGWPDCAPRANDPRMAREFLLFLSNFGPCRQVYAKRRWDERYYLDELFDMKELEAEGGASIFTDDVGQEAVMAAVRHSVLPSIIERQRTTTTVLTRPGQAKFREALKEAYGGRCFLTGEEMPGVLEAAHIIPWKHGGVDHPNNGFYLRVDVHRLFDSGNIRIKPTGELMLSDAAAASENYGALPRRVDIPRFVNPAHVRWRYVYL